jgi:plasmid rolling circle replication initiator protein Rep
MWFFEATIDLQDNGMVKINPHLHIVLLCSQMLPVKDMNNYLSGTNKINLGRINVSVPRWPNGQIKVCKPKDAINYCINYMKTDQQADGRNRGTFGTMYN